jgi:hypothetical protein
MASGNSVTQVKATDGQVSVAASHVTTDAPLLPVKELHELHSFRADLVDLVVQQTIIEGQHRRELALLTEERSYNFATRTQRISLIIIVAYILLCALIVYKEAYWFAIGMVGIGGIVVSAITALTNAGKGVQNDATPTVTKA